MLNCEEIRKIVFDYIDHEIEDPTLEEVIAHLGACRPCFSETEFLVILKKLNKKMGMEVKAPQGLQKKVHEKISNEC